MHEREDRSMEQHTEHHAMPTRGSELNVLALSATLHCLTGCALGEIAGLAIGTALGFSNLATIVLAVVLAFLIGYSLTSLPLLRAGLALSRAAGQPLAACPRKGPQGGPRNGDPRRPAGPARRRRDRGRLRLRLGGADRPGRWLGRRRARPQPSGPPAS